MTVTEGKAEALADAPAASLRNEEELNESPVCSCFQAVNKHEITAVCYVNSFINSMEHLGSQI